ncbi:MAG: PhoU domain-containing protein [Sulfurovum sp.]|nr:PhoU domain-containing protein [Sulfurovum sp.]
MLLKYQEERHKVREEVLSILKTLALVNEEGCKALKNMDTEQLEEIRKALLPIQNRTEEIDNNIVLIFAKYTPEARDLRELVSYLKITSALNRIRSNQNNYLKNIQTLLMEENPNILKLIQDSLLINRCTLTAFEHTITMFQTFDDNEKIQLLASKIEVEYAKTEDIYTLMEKDILQQMCAFKGLSEEYFHLLKYIRKNLKIIDRLDSISQRIIFARMGGKL